MLDSVKTAHQLIKRRTKNLKSGLKVHSQIIQRTFAAGNKGDKELLNKCNIVFDNALSKWNYRIFPDT
jgi:hypothetical protein